MTGRITLKRLPIAASFCLLAPCLTTFAQQPEAPATLPVPSAAPAPNTLLDGTAVKLRLMETITSAKAKVGQSVSFEVVDEVDLMGLPVIPKGAQAMATVTTAESRKSMGRGGKLEVNIDSVRLSDGEKAMLRATEGGKGGGHTGAMTAGMIGTAIVFLPAAPLLLFIHGKDITIPKGTDVTAFVLGDMHLEMAKFIPTPALAAPLGNGTAVAQVATLAVESNVTGADIEVDGVFVGNTPSTVSVASGQHMILLKKKGYGDWIRTMNVSGSSVRLSAELTAQE